MTPKRLEVLKFLAEQELPVDIAWVGSRLNITTASARGLVNGLWSEGAVSPVDYYAIPREWSITSAGRRAIERSK
jgi:DNA-binding IclR family transcriptional regulator